MRITLTGIELETRRPISLEDCCKQKGSLFRLRANSGDTEVIRFVRIFKEYVDGIDVMDKNEKLGHDSLSDHLN